MRFKEFYQAINESLELKEPSNVIFKDGSKAPSKKSSYIFKTSKGNSIEVFFVGSSEDRNLSVSFTVNGEMNDKSSGDGSRDIEILPQVFFVIKKHLEDFNIKEFTFKPIKTFKDIKEAIPDSLNNIFQEVLSDVQTFERFLDREFLGIVKQNTNPFEYNLIKNILNTSFKDTLEVFKEDLEKKDIDGIGTIKSRLIKPINALWKITSIDMLSSNLKKGIEDTFGGSLYRLVNALQKFNSEGKVKSSKNRRSNIYLRMIRDILPEWFVESLGDIIRVTKKGWLEMAILKVGDTIEWTLPDSEFSRKLGKRTFQAEIAGVCLEDGDYGVYCEYGIDLIPFGDATLVKSI